MAIRLEKKYDIDYLCTDEYSVYKKNKIYHIADKSENCLAESKNLVVRKCPARFNRRTSRFSKTIEMIEASLTLLFNRELVEKVVVYI